MLGCHFGRSEKPFIYDITKNKYAQFQEKDLFIDMYRSNDVVQYSRESIYIRPFVKVGEKADQVKVFQYFLSDALEEVKKAPVRRTLAHHARDSVDKREPGKSSQAACWPASCLSISDN